MSKARLIITAVTVEGRSQREVARAYGVNQGWVSRLVARYRAEARPRSSPAPAAPHQPDGDPAGHRRADHRPARPAVHRGLDAGPDTIAWHLAHTTAPASRRPPSAAT